MPELAPKSLSVDGFDEKLTMDETCRSRLLAEPAKEYSTCISVAEMEALLFSSRERKAKLTIDTRRVVFEISEPDGSLDAVLDVILREWHTISKCLPSAGHGPASY